MTIIDVYSLIMIILILAMCVTLLVSVRNKRIASWRFFSVAIFILMIVLFVTGFKFQVEDVITWEQLVRSGTMSYWVDGVKAGLCWVVIAVIFVAICGLVASPLFFLINAIQKNEDEM